MFNYSKYELFMKQTAVHESEIDYNIKDPNTVYDFAVNIMELNSVPQEVFVIIMLDSKGGIIGYSEISRGTLNGSMVHPREVFKPAIVQNACSIIALHNHPSGDSTPTREDIEVTDRLREAGKLIGIELCDHVIVGDCCKTSLKEMGYF